MPLQRNKIRVTIGFLKKKKTKFIDIFFKLIHIIFAYDYGFFIYESRNMKILTKIFTVAHGLFINLVNLTFIYITLPPLHAFAGTLNVIVHLVNVLILIYFDKNTFCNFLKDLEVIDFFLDSNHDSDAMGLKIAFSLMVGLGYKIILTILYCVNSHKYCLKPMVMQIWFFIPLLAYDIPLIVTFFTYHAVRFRLKKIINFVENKSPNILQYHHIYKALVDTIERIKISFDIMVSVSDFLHQSVKF